MLRCLDVDDAVAADWILIIDWVSFNALGEGEGLGVHCLGLGLGLGYLKAGMMMVL